MVFSSITFIFYFLPPFLILYYLAEARLKDGLLLLASVVFYAWGEPLYVLLMLATIVIEFGLVRGLEHRHRVWRGFFFILALALPIASLMVFKYGNFIITNLNILGVNLPETDFVLPVGISFYTFQILSYVIEVRRGRIRAEKNILHLGIYICMFPQLIAGPIERYECIHPLIAKHHLRFVDFNLGIKRFVLGLGKKVLLANLLAEFLAKISVDATVAALDAWLTAFVFLLQLYLDFSAYSDMAIGLGDMLGFRLSENFAYPLFAAGPTEFWRRWHITLGKWFRDYIYIPMGGSRSTSLRTLLNLLVVWLCTGLWHGAAWNFIIWGLLNFVLVVLERYFGKVFTKIPGVLRVILNLILMNLVFVFFSHESISEALFHIKAMFSAPLILSSPGCFWLADYAVVILLAALAATPWPQRLSGLIRCFLAKKSWGAPICSVAEFSYVALLFLLSVAFLVDGSFNPFLYFRF